MTATMSNTLIEECLTWITSRNGVSLVELENWASDHGIPTDGNISIEPRHNLIMWAGVSEQFCDLLDALRATGRIVPRPLGPLEAFLVYSCDGKLLSLPVAKRPPKNGYRDPHWLATYLGVKP